MHRLASGNRVLSHPLTAYLVAAAIVGVIGWAGTVIPRPAPATGIRVQKVMLARAPAPMLKLNTHGEALQSSEQGVPATATSSSNDAPQIVREGRVSLYVTNVSDSVRALSALARAAGGDVFSLDFSNADRGSGGSAQMQVRVPSVRFNEAMERIGRIGTIRSRSESAEDVTGTITDSNARLRNLRQTEADIRSIMNRSGSVSQVLDAENQLSQVREQIETLESDIADMQHRVAYATISLDVQTEVTTAPVEPSPLSQLAQTWNNALHAVRQIAIGLAGIVLWTAAFLPFALAAAGVVWIGRRKRAAAR